MQQQLILESSQATELLGRAFASAIIATKPESICLFLHGELGAGKTTFARGFLRGCGHTGRVPSPTYTLIEPYECAGYQLYHIDLYRLQGGEELEFLGIQEMNAGASIMLVEWPERGAEQYLSSDLDIKLKVLPEGRSAEIVATSGSGQNILTAIGSQDAFNA